MLVDDVISTGGSLKAMEALVEKAGGIDFSMPLALGYTGLSDAVLKKYIEDSAALWAGHAENELPIHTIGATIGTHVGPGAVAVAFFRPAN